MECCWLSYQHSLNHQYEVGEDLVDKFSGANLAKLGSILVLDVQPVSVNGSNLRPVNQFYEVAALHLPHCLQTLIKSLGMLSGEAAS